jgi:hypothetical protein
MSLSERKPSMERAVIHRRVRRTYCRMFAPIVVMRRCTVERGVAIVPEDAQLNR